MMPFDGFAPNISHILNGFKKNLQKKQLMSTCFHPLLSVGSSALRLKVCQFDVVFQIITYLSLLLSKNLKWAFTFASQTKAAGLGHKALFDYFRWFV